MLKKYFLLSQLWTVVLLNIYVESVIFMIQKEFHFFSKEQHLFKIDFFL